MISLFLFAYSSGSQLGVALIDKRYWVMFRDILGWTWRMLFCWYLLGRGYVCWKHSKMHQTVPQQRFILSKMSVAPGTFEMDRAFLHSVPRPFNTSLPTPTPLPYFPWVTPPHPQNPQGTHPLIQESSADLIWLWEHFSILPHTVSLWALTTALFCIPY
jgi:hypothetical protein